MAEVNNTRVLIEFVASLHVRQRCSGVVHLVLYVRWETLIELEHPTTICWQAGAFNLTFREVQYFLSSSL